MKSTLALVVILAACGCSGLDEGEGLPDRDRPACYQACMGQNDVPEDVAR